MGSCSKSDLPQPLWAPILEHEPDMWVWLGDNVYADTESEDIFRTKYNRQLDRNDYKLFRKSVPIMGVWDDHDYGVNDGGREYPKKELSKREMLRFLGVPESDPVWDREGVYQSRTFEEDGRRMKVLLLDARWFRDPAIRVNRIYQPNDTGDILGEAQWAWLEKELSQPMDLVVIGSGIQILPQEHPFEKWANFPTARQRLFGLLEKSPARQIVLVSGDRHIAELSKLDTDGGRRLVEMTTSGLTHSWRNVGDEPNRHRVGQLTGELNFGLIKIDWEQEPPAVELEIRGEDNILYQQYKIKQ
jgi:alkaline phosphatase D